MPDNDPLAALEGWAIQSLHIVPVYDGEIGASDLPRYYTAEIIDRGRYEGSGATIAEAVDRAVKAMLFAHAAEPV